MTQDGQRAQALKGLVFHQRLQEQKSPETLDEYSALPFASFYCCFMKQREETMWAFVQKWGDLSKLHVGSAAVSIETKRINLSQVGMPEAHWKGYSLSEKAGRFK